jgi:hypothetical protein
MGQMLRFLFTIQLKTLKALRALPVGFGKMLIAL